MTTVDPRIQRTHDVVLAATVELLVEHGFERITIDSIAERTGIARSTIYRHWPDRYALFAEAFELMCEEPVEPDTGSLEGDLRTMATALARGLAKERWGRTLPSLVSAAASDADLKAAYLEFNARRRDVNRAIFERAVERGEVSSDVDLDLAVTRFAGPFFFGHLVSDIELDKTFIDQMVAATLAEVTR